MADIMRRVKNKKKSFVTEIRDKAFFLFFKLTVDYYNYPLILEIHRLPQYKLHSTE